MLLESVERRVMAAQTLADIEQKLHAMECWTEERFQNHLTELLDCLPEWLDRPITDAERAVLAQSAHLGIFLSLSERLIDAPQDSRERLLREATEGDAGQSHMPPAEESSQP